MDIEGRVAAYAGNQDYHDVLGERLEALIHFIESEYDEPFPYRWYTDTGPILERDLAQRAGLGWIGKNTTLINREFGSYFFLAEIFLGIKLMIDSPFTAGHCGSCTSCLDACPTGSLIAPYTLDARLCISYQTIENRESIPIELRPLQGEWIFGCDICQEVCPWNQKLSRDEYILPEFLSRPEISRIDLRSELKISSDEFKAKFKGSPISRAKRRGYLRNIAVALGNQGAEEVVPVLVRLLQDPDSILRGHAAWALGKIGGKAAQRGLETAVENEKDSAVMEEIQESLKELAGSIDS
jgi:epoxyqueuosine reductase